MPWWQVRENKLKDSSRTDFMHTLRELIGACPPAKQRTFRDEWQELNVEVGMLAAAAKGETADAAAIAEKARRRVLHA